jgi:hypothetical protein
VNYGCYLKSVETLGKPGAINFRFDLVNGKNNIVSINIQSEGEMKGFFRGKGLRDLIDPATIRDHILKVKMWTSEYDFEYDLVNITITDPSIPLPSFLIGENKLRIDLKKNKGGTKYDCLIKDIDSTISSRSYFQVELFKRLDNRLVKSEKFDLNPDTDVDKGISDWADVESIRDHVLKVKILFIKPLSDFIDKPIGVDDYRNLLFKKMSSNLSFQV